MRLVAKELLDTRSSKIKSLIYLDGVEQKDVIVADSDLHFVESICKDDKGKYFSSEQGDSVKTEVVFGTVEIVIPSV